MFDQTNKPTASGYSEHSINVLLIDDQAIVGDAVRRMLAQEKDINFHFCQEPTKAIPMAAEIMPTVILQDLVMPDIDGLTMVRFFRAHPKLKDIPLIVLSSKEEATTKAEAFSLGANDYLVKLPDRIELIARIRYHSQGYINLLQRNEAFEALLASRQALAAELSRAADYVVSLLPAPMTEGSVRTDWRFMPSAELGGDCFGYHWIDDHHFAMYLLDVCGHGVGSALLSVSAINTLRTQSLPGVDFLSPKNVLSGLNETFQMDRQNGLYFTIWYGVFDTAWRKLVFGAAGHPPAMLRTAPGHIQEISVTNMIIGGIPGMPYDDSSIEVPPDAELYIFSDGAYEVTRPDGSMWDLSGLKEWLRCPPESTESAIDLLYRHVQTMHGEPGLEDDYSVMTVNFK